MSLEKAIAFGKEHRKPYYDARSFDWTCRAHGSCSYCYSNRMYRTRIVLESLADEWNDGEWTELVEYPEGVTQ